MSLSIAPWFRAQLALKGGLLAGMGLGFLAIALTAWSKPWSLAAQLGYSAFFAWAGLFPLRMSVLALADAVRGRAVRIQGAIALDARGRRRGFSLSLPQGGFAEFVLFNPWEALVPGQRYTVVIGERSKVIVEPPSPDARLDDRPTTHSTERSAR